MDAKAYWIGFNKVRGIGYVRTKKLIDYFGDLGSAWEANEISLVEAGLGAKLVREFLDARKSINLDKELEQILSKGIQILTLEDSGYPQNFSPLNSRLP